jgi:predicted nucleotidyltransferase
MRSCQILASTAAVRGAAPVVWSAAGAEAQRAYANPKSRPRLPGPARNLGRIVATPSPVRAPSLSEEGERIMLTLLADKLPELERLCKLYGVRRLEVVGSAAREVDFDPARSDIDLLVEFAPGRLPRLSAFFKLREAIENAVGRPVDLLMLEAVRNPYLKASLERNRRLLYAA